MIDSQLLTTQAYSVFRDTPESQSNMGVVTRLRDSTWIIFVQDYFE